MSAVSLTNLLPSSLLDTTVQKTLGEEFSLCENRSMVFHWADFHETCGTIQDQIEAHPSLREDFQRRQKAVERLGDISVWIRTNKKIHHTSMFELYQRYVLNQSGQLGNIDPFAPIEISFISGTGPFKSMAIAECFNKHTYQDFILVNLLKGKLPRRDYRIRLQARVLVEYGKDFQSAKLVNLEQMTAKGILLSVDADFFVKELSQGPSMRMLLNTELLRNCMGKDLGALQAHLSQYTFNLMYSSRKEDGIECAVSSFSSQSSFDFFRNKRVYLFTTYETLAASHPQAAENMQSFVAYTRELVREHYRRSFSPAESA